MLDRRPSGVKEPAGRTTTTSSGRPVGGTTGKANPCSAVQRDQREERAAIGWEDLGWPRELEPPAEGWRDWWLRDEER
jgi:hypothetical protein